MYRVWIPLLYKVIRILYCQFVEEGELAKLLSAIAATEEEFDQTFELNLIEPRGTLLVLPAYINIKEAEDNTLSNNSSIAPTDENDIPAAEPNIDAVLKQPNLLTISLNAKRDNNNRETLLLERPIDETLLRSARLRTKTTKARAQYTLADMLRATVKALTTAVTANELADIVIPKSFKELQTIVEAKQQLKATYREIRIYIKNRTQRDILRYTLYKVLRSRWVFLLKRDSNSKLSRFKARQVVRGFS